MKRFVAVLLICCLLAVLMLPVIAATPQNAMVVATQEAVGAALGKSTPGAAVVLFENGQRVMLEGFGYADIEERTLVAADTAFEIGPLSSLFVVLACDQLAREGRLELTVDITDYLPADFVVELGLRYTTTLQDLLYHMASFEGRSFDMRFEKPSYCFDTLRDALLSQVPVQTVGPGSYYSYSPFGIGLAAYVVECVAGVPYAEYVTQSILTPLGMTHTWLDPRADSEIDPSAKGHVVIGERSFAVAARDGRSYSGIWPADGAISTPADLALLLEHLLGEQEIGTTISAYRKNGVFDVSLLGPAVTGSACATAGETLYFGASLALDVTNGKAALVLVNTVGSALLSLPATLCGIQAGVNVDMDALPDLENYKGAYASLTLARNTLVGLLGIKDSSIVVEPNEDGTLQCGERRLRQIARGVFADADTEGQVAVLQFLLTVEGEIIAMIDAQGNTYLPVPLWQQNAPATILYVLLMACILYFLVVGGFATLSAAVARLRGDDGDSWRFVLPRILSAVLSLLALWQVLVAASLGASAMASFFSALSVISLVVGIAAAACHLFAFFTAFVERGRSARVVRDMAVFLALLFLCKYWHLIVF